MYRNKTIFAIAINDYDGIHCVSLINPVSDANRFIKVLIERFGFSKAREPLFNDQASRDNIEDALYSISDCSYSEDVLIVFYAGHGGQDDFSKGGYWHPVDGQDPNRKSKLLRNTQILEAINTMRFKHILLVSDSCYSGTFITRIPNSGLPSSLDDADSLESRWVFVSGGEENVKDGRLGAGSPFMDSVCRFLETNKKKRFPATDLFAAVKREFTTLGTQSPQASPLESPGHNGGIFVFENSDPASNEEIDKLIASFPIPFNPSSGYYIERTLSPRDGESSLTILFGLETNKKKLFDLIEFENRLVVLGNAGSGKSRELIHLWELLNRSNGRFLPVYKRFHTYVDQPIADFLPTGWESIDPFMAVYLFDGLDEVQPQHFANAVRSLEEFVTAHPDSKFVISCRTNFYELPSKSFTGTLNSFSVYELNDLSLYEIKTYVSIGRGLDGDHFIEEVHKHYLLDLVQKPFFLEFLLKYFERHSSLTYQRSAIIEDALKAQLIVNRQRLNATEHGRKLDVDTAFGMLEKIGFVMEQIGRNYLTNDDFRTLFPAFEDRELVKDLPMFFHDDLNGRWQFVHNNIQEYLAAKVLNKLPFWKILALVSIPSANKIKPSWANTLSFFVSIGDTLVVNALLDWLVQYQSEFILRFEAEGLTNQMRIKVVLNIIETHAKENIWFSSTIFSEQDIARIGVFSEVIHHLQADLNNLENSTTVRMNAFRILRYMNFDNFPAEKKAFSDSLLQLVRNEDTLDHFLYSALNTLGDLHLLGLADLDALVEQYKNNINAYIRAGIYFLLIETETVDRYMDFFLDGLNPDLITNPKGERSSVLLLDELTRLVHGLSKIRTVVNVKKLLELFNMPGRWLHFGRDDNNKILDNMVSVAITSYPGDPSIYNSVLKASILTAQHFNHDNCMLLSRFFHATGTAYDALREVLAQPMDFVKGEIIPLLVESSMIATLIDQFQAHQLSEDQVRQIHSAFTWHKRSLCKGADELEGLEQGLLKATGLDLRVPDSPIPPQLPKINLQFNLDLLFDKSRFRDGVKSYYQLIGKQTITWGDVVKFRANNQDYFSVNSPVFTFFSDYFHTQIEYSLDSTLKFLETPHFDNWVMAQIHRKLEENNATSEMLSTEQIELVEKWVNRTLGHLNLRGAIDQSDDIVRVLWHFILRFGLTLPPEKLFPFTLYYDFKSKVELYDIGTIDQLEKLTPKDKLLEIVVGNLVTQDLSILPWLNNASYAITHKLTATYPSIVKYLVMSSDPEYKFPKLLELWANQVDGFTQIQKVAQSAANISLRLSALELMAKNAELKGATSTLLAEMLTDVDLEIHDKFQAAKQLIKLNDTRGVAFIADQIETARVNISRADTWLIFQVAEIKTIDALPHLLRLIAVALTPDVKARHEIDYFFSPLLEGLFNIGIQSSMALAEVDKQVTVFIAENTGKFAGLEVLKVNLRRLHERFNSEHAQPLTLQEAIAEYQKI